jgi:uncharacterized protein with PIN domain
MTSAAPQHFACDAMLGGLARWLRAAGHDAAWTYGIEDRALVESARREARTILTSDEPLARAIGAAGLPSPSGKDAPRPPLGEGPYPPALFVPRGLSKYEQLRHVLRSLRIPLLPARCMTCGGSLRAVERGEAAAEAPALTLLRVESFWRCAACGKLFWEGTHWEKIRLRLLEAAGPGTV